MTHVELQAPAKWWMSGVGKESGTYILPFNWMLHEIKTSDTPVIGIG